MSAFAARMDFSAYAYLYGRVSGMTGKIVAKKEVESLIHATSDMEVLASLEATDYEPYINDIKIGGYTAVELQHMFYNYFRDVFNEIIAITPLDAGELFKAFHEGLWDHANMKTIFRCVHQKESLNEISRLLIPLGNISQEEARRFSSFESVKSLLEETGFYTKDAAEKAYGEYEDSQNLTLLESFMDSIFHKRYTTSFRDTIFEEYVLFCADLLNVKNIIRCARDEIDANPYLVDDGLSITDETRKKASAATIDELEHVFSKTDYAKLVSKATHKYRVEGTLSFLENMTDAYRISYLNDKAKIEPLSVYPAAYFIELKMREIKMLTGIILSKREGLSIDETKEILGGYGL